MTVHSKKAARSYEALTCPACSTPALVQKPDHWRRELRLGVALFLTGFFTVGFIWHLLRPLVPWIVTCVVFRVPSSFTQAQILNPWIYVLFYLLLLQLAGSATITLLLDYHPMKTTCSNCGYTYLSTPGFTWRGFFRRVFHLPMKEQAPIAK